MDLLAVVAGIQQSSLYLAILVFYAFYPIASSLIWISTSILYWQRRERRQPPGLYDFDRFPLVSVLVPAYCEEKTIATTLAGVLALDYPNFEVVVVDDGSPDGTADAALPYVRSGQVRLIRKTFNEGKAMALNDAMPCLRGELVLILDADAYPDPAVLR